MVFGDKYPYIQKGGQNKSPQHGLFLALDYISKNIFKIEGFTTR